MVQTRRHLPEHRELGSLDELLLGFTQLRLGSLPLLYLFQQLVIGTFKIGCPLSNATLQLLSPPQGQFTFPPVSFAEIQPGKEPGQEQGQPADQETGAGPEY